MSDAVLQIGRLPEGLEGAVLDAVSEMGIASSEVWSDGASATTDISLFNLSTVVLFTKYVASLEGLSDAGAAQTASRFRNLPWWQSSVWIPAEFTPSLEPALEIDGWPVFLGSVHGLLADLRGIQSMSNLSLGERPEGFEAMRSDFRAFMRSGFSISEERALIQWVWRGLYEGAELALRGEPLLLEML